MKKIKLGDVLNVKRGASLSGEHYSNKGTLIRLTLGNFNYPNNGFKYNTSKDDLYFVGPISSEFILRKGDIITPLTEQVRGLLGNTAIIPDNNTFIQSGDIGLIIPNEELIDKRFAYYLVSSPIVKKQLDAGSQQTKIRHTSPDRIKDCIAFIPELEEQRKIAKLLDDINNKIEINNKINDNLQQLLMQCYIQKIECFNGIMPTEFNVNLKRKIPKGWKSIKINQIASVHSGYSFNSSNYNKIGKYKLITIKNVQDSGVDLNTGDKIENLPSDLPEYCKLSPGDILLSLTGNVGRVALMFTENCLLNQRVAVIHSKNVEISPYLYCLFKSERLRHKMERIACGTSQKNLSPVDTENLYIPYNESLILEFSKELYPLFNKIINCLEEKRRLITLRNDLLPLLINGQVTIK